MGLYVHTLSNIPANHHRDYYIYLLDYGWKEPLGEALVSNYEKMATIAAENKAVVIRGTRRVHFEDEVLSWHNINGENAEELLPAILITNRHPQNFRESYGQEKQVVENDLKLILIPLKLFCRTTTDVIQLIEKVFNDIIKQKYLSDFRIAKEIQKGRKRVLADAIILEPNHDGGGLGYEEIIAFLSKDEIIENLKLKLNRLKNHTKTVIQNGLEEFDRGNYVSSIRILYPAIEEITNQMLADKGENPNNRNKFKGLSDKLSCLETHGSIDSDLVQSIKITTERNSVLHGSYNPLKQELARPLCYSSMTFLTELIR